MNTKFAQACFTAGSRWILAAMIGMAGMAFSPSAHAAPSISATPNPVVFQDQNPNTKKSVTINWAGEKGFNQVDVFLSINGQARTKWIDSAKGKSPKTYTEVKLGNTYRFYLTSNKGKNDLANVLVITKYESQGGTLKPGKFPKIPLDEKPKFPGPGFLAFFKNVNISPRGRYVSFKFDTTKSTLPLVQVSAKAPKKVPPLGKDDIPVFNQADIISTAFAKPGLSHDAVLPVGSGSGVVPLQPNTQYFYAIKASSEGVYYTITGKFRTQKRRVYVVFEKICIIDDSDDLSPGDLQFGLFINGQNAFNGKPMIYPSKGSVSLGSQGANCSLNSNVWMSLPSILFEGEVSNAPKTLVLKVVGCDDDSPPGGFKSCGTIVTNPNATGGSNNAADWMSGSVVFDLEALAQAADYSYPEIDVHNFTIAAIGKASDLAFLVSGRFTVNFVP